MEFKGLRLQFLSKRFSILCWEGPLIQLTSHIIRIAFNNGYLQILHFKSDIIKWPLG